MCLVRTSIHSLSLVLVQQIISPSSLFLSINATIMFADLIFIT